MSETSFTADDLPIAVMEISDDGVITFVNSEAENLAGRSRKMMVGQPWVNFLAPAHRDARDLSAEALGRARVLVAHDVEMVHGSGSTFTCDLHFGMGGGSGGRFIVILPNTQMNGLGAGNDATRAARSAIGMSEMLAHEIKNPLAGITGAAQLLGATAANSEDRELTELIVEECRRVERLIGQVEAFGNVLPAKRDRVNIHDCIDQAIRSVSLGVGRAAEFRREYDPSLPEALADRDQLVQVILNLLKNAAEARFDAVITVKTRFDPGLRMKQPDGLIASVPLQICISDNGPGIPDNLSDTLFEPFVSGRQNGTGLGLALVAKLVTGMGAFTTYQPGPAGAEFRISLPMCIKDA